MLLAMLLPVVAGLGLAVLPPQRVSAQTTTMVYVDHDASAAPNDGSSWANAYTTLQDALDVTNANPGTAYEIWVAEGVYYPDEGGSHVNNSRTESFRLSKDNVQLYGGFAATETLRIERDWTAHPTILSGDLEQDDRNTDANAVTEMTTQGGVAETKPLPTEPLMAPAAVPDEHVGSVPRPDNGTTASRVYLPFMSWSGMQWNNAYHVLSLDGATGPQITAATVIDGFTITGGEANASEDEGNDRGGGLYCVGRDSGQVCSPSLVNLTFSSNRANGDGGALYNYCSYCTSSPSLVNVTFSGNQAGSSGGAMYNYRTSPSLLNVTFSGNQATDGGAMYNNAYYSTSSPSLVNVTFSGNRANRDGGALYNYGSFGTSSPSLVNVTFSGNQAGSGGGAMYNYGTAYSISVGISSPSLVHVTFNGNQATDGGAMYNNGSSGTSSPSLVNVTFSGNRANRDGGALYNNVSSADPISYYGTSSPSLVHVTFSGNRAGGNGGAMWSAGFNYGRSSPSLVNVTFSGNQAGGSGGAMWNAGVNGGTSSASLVNVTFSGNQATTGGAMYNAGSDGGTCSPSLVNVIVWGNTANTGGQIFNNSATPTLRDSLVEGGCPSGATCGGGMLSDDPRFVNPIAATNAPTTTGDYRLLATSPAINAGDNSAVPADVSTDLDGNPRIVQSRVDLGAYESQAGPEQADKKAAWGGRAAHAEVVASVRENTALDHTQIILVVLRPSYSDG